jgi:hypothetical protein
MIPPSDTQRPEEEGQALAALRLLVAERQLGLNSGKPPSSDGLKKKPAQVF